MARNPNAKRYKTATAFRLDDDLMQQLDTFCRAHPLAPTRTGVLEAALREFLNKYPVTSPPATKREDRAVASAQA